MRVRSLICGVGVALVAGPVAAAEGGFSVYGLGGAAFNAGITPPAGTYVTPLVGYYTGVIEGSATVGGVDINAGAEAGFFQTGVNFLHAPEEKILGGNAAFGLTLGIGYIDLAAELSAGGPGVTAEANGWGLADTWIRGQLGWSEGTFFHTAYLQAVLPTGTYEPGFAASTGLNRPAIDAGWAFTWIEPESKIQVNGQAGITYNFENTATDYQSGMELHLDWAIGKDFGNGLTLGVVGYNYRQLTPDSGAGATLGDFMGSVDAIGLGANYATELGETPAVFSFRHYREFNAVNRFEGSTTLATLTLAF